MAPARRHHKVREAGFKQTRFEHWSGPALRADIVRATEELPMPDQPDPDETGAYRPDPAPPSTAERFVPGHALGGAIPHRCSLGQRRKWAKSTGPTT